MTEVLTSDKRSTPTYQQFLAAARLLVGLRLFTTDLENFAPPESFEAIWDDLGLAPFSELGAIDAQIRALRTSLGVVLADDRWRQIERTVKGSAKAMHHGRTGACMCVPDESGEFWADEDSTLYRPTIAERVAQPDRQRWTRLEDVFE